MPSTAIRIRLDTTVLDRILRNAPAKAERAALDSAEAVVKDIRAHWSGHYPPASRPGAPPAERSGYLDTHIRAEPRQVGSKRMVQIEARAPYASFLEFGTRKMRARPFLRPAMYRARKDFKGRWKEVVSA